MLSKSGMEKTHEWTKLVLIKSSDPAIRPGGAIDPPTWSKVPLLDLKIQQRQSPYLASDKEASFIIDTSVIHPLILIFRF